MCLRLFFSVMAVWGKAEKTKFEAWLSLPQKEEGFVQRHM